jgi:hypothetical protein
MIWIEIHYLLTKMCPKRTQIFALTLKRLPLTEWISFFILKTNLDSPENLVEDEVFFFETNNGKIIFWMKKIKKNLAGTRPKKVFKTAKNRFLKAHFKENKYSEIRFSYLKCIFILKSQKLDFLKCTLNECITFSIF